MMSSGLPIWEKAPSFEEGYECSRRSTEIDESRAPRSSSATPA
jgi:hypothetical protein